MILIDSNIFMYAAGAAHPHKQPSAAFLDRVARGDVDAAIDAEVLQEVLHRYRAIGRWDDGKRVFDMVRRIVPIVFPITAAVLDEARILMEQHVNVMARDALHAAVARLEGAQDVCSYDRDFDAFDGLTRVEP